MTQLSLHPAIERVFPPFTELPEPLLAFGSRTVRRGLHVHPLLGLVDHGPYTLATGSTQPLRLGLVAPHDQLDTAQRIVDELRRPHRPTERRDYLVNYPGFLPVFGLDLATAPDSIIGLPEDLDDRARNAEDPRGVLFDALDAAVRHAADRGGFDVLLVRAPKYWDDWLSGDSDNVLHDHIKITAAAHRVATQVIRDRALVYPDRCSVAWRLAIATYAKAGGIPWKLASTAPNTLFIGIGYALRPTAGNRFVIGAAHIFDERGTGLSFVTTTATEDDGTVIHGSNPHLSRPQMHALISRALDAYQHRNDGHLPRRVAIHKSSRWQGAETEGAFDALGRIHDIDLIQVQASTPWRAVRGTASSGTGGEPDSWPVHRGTLLHLAEDELLLWTQGNTPGAATVGTNYSQHGPGVARPLLLRRWAGHASAEQVAAEVLALTKMDWNNDGLHNRLPATCTTASIVARAMGAQRLTTGAAQPGRWFT